MSKTTGQFVADDDVAKEVLRCREAAKKAKLAAAKALAVAQKLQEEADSVEALYEERVKNMSKKSAERARLIMRGEESEE